MFKRILVPLDGSELAELALPPAVQLAEATGAELLLLRSMMPSYMMTPVVAGDYGWIWPENSIDSMREEARDYLTSVQMRYARPDVRWLQLLVEGDPASQIVDTAFEEAVDLIVMSTHGWSGFTRWTMGSVTERVLQHAACAVFVARSDQPVKRMLITLDGSLLAERAIEPALSLASGLDARVILLRVTEPLFATEPQVQYEWSIGEEMVPETVQRRQGEAEAYLCDVAIRHGHVGTEMELRVVNGPTVDTLLEFAKQNEVDLIAMSTHGRTGLRRWLYGSVTAKVMRRFDGHMLIVRPPIVEAMQ
jgi:nucleotide-binding universal stress UspA family protein